MWQKIVIKKLFCIKNWQTVFLPQFYRWQKALHFCVKEMVWLPIPLSVLAEQKCFAISSSWTIKLLRHDSSVVDVFIHMEEATAERWWKTLELTNKSLRPRDASRAKTLIINAATTLTPKCSSFDAHRWHTKSNPSLIIIVHGQANSIRPLSLSLKTADERGVAPRQFQQADRLIISGTLATCVCALSRVGMCLFQLLSSAADVALIKLN